MDGNIMYAYTNNWRSTARCEPWPFVGYLSSSTRVSAYETSGGKFFGPKRNWYAPQAIQTGKLTNTPFRNYDEFPFGVLKSNVRMAPGETKKATFLLGMERSRDLVKQKVAKYNALKYTEDQLQNVKDFYRDFLSNTLTINTPDKANDRIINIWSQYHWRQFLKKDLDTEAHGSAFWAYGLEGSTLWFHPELTLVGLDMQLVKKSLISILLSNQVPDPTNVNIFMGPDAMLDKDIDKQWPPRPEDMRSSRTLPHHHWIYVYCLNIYFYILETGDFDFLSETLPYIDGTKGTVWEHIRMGIETSTMVINKRGLAVIPKGHGDWMDEFTKISKEGKAESIMLAAQMAYILKGFAQIAEKIGEDADRSHWMSIYEKIAKGINAYGWDGEWYTRAFSDTTPQQPVGSSKNKEGKIYLNSQSWPIIAGLAPRDRENKALAAVDKYLTSEYGVLVFWPSYTQYVDHIGTQSIYNPGFRNGNIYFRPAGWAIIAAAINGRADLANRLYNSTSLAQRSNDINTYLLEPYAYPENYIGPDHHRAGEGQFHWCFGEGTAWMWYAYVAYILGVRAALDGLIIDPRIPKDWDGYEVKRTFRNAHYEIVVKNPEHVSKGIRSIKVDGKKIKENLIYPHEDGKTHKVEVIMGS